MMPIIPNRARRLSLATVALVLSSTFASPASAQEKANPKLAAALGKKPVQADVIYAQVDTADYDKCDIEEGKRDGFKGFWVTGPAGEPLRWFRDTNGDNKLDTFGYYHAGVEVYREIDSDFNEKTDSYRWLSTQGLRWGIDKNEDGEIDRWNMISAEEVTAEVIRAIASRDASRFSRLIIEPEEIDELGLGDEKAELLSQRARDARKQFAAWSQGQNVVSRTSKWTNFGADKPGIVPAGTDGSEQDIVVYENAVALFEDREQAKQLMVGTLIRVGDNWRLVDLPRGVDEGSIVDEAGLFFTASFSPKGGSTSENAPMQGGISKAMERLVTDLQKIDAKMQAGDGKLELLHDQRADVLEKLVSASTTEEDQQTWIQQFADTVSAAVQTGEYPDGAKRLNMFARKLTTIDATKDQMAYVIFRAITSAHNLQMQQEKADYEKLQAAYLKNLEGFVTKYPESADTAEAMLQLALASEFSGDLATSKKWYGRARSAFSDSMAGQKAAGALRRLECVGEQFRVGGTTLDNRQFNPTALRGSPVIYHCWASWCSGCVSEMRALKVLQTKYAKQKVRVVGINLDNERSEGLAFLKKNNFPWVHLHDKGALESKFAVTYGILTLPSNFVVDGSGKVVAVGVHFTELDGIINEVLEKK